jgi:hypothetical protein
MEARMKSDESGKNEAISKSEDKDNIFKFLLAEHSKLRDEILQHIKQMEDDERWILVASGGFWGWVYVHEPLNEKYQFIIWLPSVINFLFIARWYFIRDAIISIHKYFVKLENEIHAIGMSPLFGWENRIKNSRRDWMDWKSLGFLVVTLTMNLCVTLLHLKL